MIKYIASNCLRLEILIEQFVKAVKLFAFITNLIQFLDKCSRLQNRSSPIPQPVVVVLLLVVVFKVHQVIFTATPNLPLVNFRPKLRNEPNQNRGILVLIHDTLYSEISIKRTPYKVGISLMRTVTPCTNGFTFKIL